MAGVVIEELDNTSDESYGSPHNHSENDSASEESYHPCQGDEVPSADAARTTDATSPLGPSSERAEQEDAREKVEASAELTEEEKENLDQAEDLKLKGNELYGSGQYRESLDEYRQALELAPGKASMQRAVYNANSAAAYLKLEEFAEAAKSCSAALSANPQQSLQIKALTRRSIAYEKLDDLEHALADHEKLVELDPRNTVSRNAIQRMKPIVEERREKMKDEMIGKLKELGNTVLGKFGMSLDNFKAEKDPQTGSYSINFKQ